METLGATRSHPVPKSCSRGTSSREQSCDSSQRIDGSFDWIGQTLERLAAESSENPQRQQIVQRNQRQGELSATAPAGPLGPYSLSHRVPVGTRSPYSISACSPRKTASSNAPEKTKVRSPLSS